MWLFVESLNKDVLTRFFLVAECTVEFYQVILAIQRHLVAFEILFAHLRTSFDKPERRNHIWKTASKAKQKNLQFSELSTSVLAINDHVFDSSSKAGVVDELLLKEQRRATDYTIRVQIFDDDNVIHIADSFHSAESICKGEG